MSGFYAAAVTVCASAVVCALLSSFVTDGSSKRIIGLVMGAFMVCSLIVPVKNAVSGFKLDLGSSPSAEQITATADEAVTLRVIAQTKENLELALKDILAQNGIEINSCETVLADSGEGRIIISSVSIYISKDNPADADRISELTRQNLGVEPDIITE